MDKNIKLVIQVSDIHVRNASRFEEYAEQLSKFIEQCKDIASNYDRDEVRIVICGDIAHSKNIISTELITFISTFIRQLEEIANVIVIAGNHDMTLNNMSRKDAISAIFETAAFSNSFLLDSELDYHSGYVVDNNVTWALYSIFDSYNKPNIEKARKENENNIVIGLYHGMIRGASLYNGNASESGIDEGIFEGCDMVMCGDIHKHQTMKMNGVDIVYSGSLIQQNFGETVTQHGFVVWDLEKKTHEFVELQSDYGLYKFEIKSVTDIDNDREILCNL